MRTAQAYYFLGIGGIGMSAIARYFHAIGIPVSGYDRTSTQLTQALEQEGIPVMYSDDPNMIHPEFMDADIVYTPAIPKDSQLFNWFRNRGNSISKRSEILGFISRQGFNISIGGTHGKTTTSCLVSHLLRTGNVHFTAFLGGVSSDLGSNYFNSCTPEEPLCTVTEADEFDRSFLTLRPDISIITSTDADHLDIYGKPDEVRLSFEAFAACLQKDGTLFQRDGLRVPVPTNVRSITYGCESGDLQAINIRLEAGYFQFDLKGDGFLWKDLELGIPGYHNVENATAAIGVARIMGVNELAIREGLRSFRGVKRRFEYIFRTENLVYIDDYAHHPTELNAIIGSVRKMYPNRKITGIFQPHLYSRTRDFAEGFAASLEALDRVWIMPIYPARELPIPGVSSEMILNLMNHPMAGICDRKDILQVLKSEKQEVILTLGAGDIDLEVEKIKHWLHEAAG